MISDFQNKKILLVSPHPDDIEIGMGGTTIILSKKISYFISFVPMVLDHSINTKIKKLL